jgi:hypothetical protein
MPRSGRYAASRQARRPLVSRLMTERPTGVWRERVASDVAGIAAGTLDADHAVAAQLWHEDMVRDTDELLDGFEADVAGLVNHRYQAPPQSGSHK